MSGRGFGNNNGVKVESSLNPTKKQSTRPKEVGLSDAYRASPTEEVQWVDSVLISVPNFKARHYSRMTQIFGPKNYFQ